MKIRVSHFCSLSRSDDWQSWLSSNAPDLLNTLQNTIKKGGCKDVKNVMINIYNKLYERDLNDKFENFIRNRFPYIVDDNRTGHVAPVIKKKINNYSKVRIVQKDNKIFDNYYPGLLTFPQRIIFSGNIENLERAINKFMVDKFGVDYIIIGNKAYIEYFEFKYRDIVDKVPKNEREIRKYKDSIL